MVQLTEEELLKKLVIEINKHTPWEWCDRWKNSSDYFTWLRGTFRSVWSRKWIPKNNYLKEKSFPVPTLDKEGNQKYYKTGKKKGKPVTHKAFKCEITEEILPIKEGQVDHISPAGSCRNGLEACIFLFRLLTSQDNMRLISKDAHKIITHMERFNMAWEEAVAAKAVIAKLKQSVNIQIKELLGLGYDSKSTSNKEKRKMCYQEIFKNKSN